MAEGGHVGWRGETSPDLAGARGGIYRLQTARRRSILLRRERSASASRLTYESGLLYIHTPRPDGLTRTVSDVAPLQLQEPAATGLLYHRYSGSKVELS